ncbi:ABC transporter permease [Streptomyces sp. SID14478]|nr:ABC transporter permease [Streptomyces sp. SID14478]
MRGALLSYRALFTWLNPLGYVSSRIVRPIGMAIAFTSLSSYYGEGGGRMLVGASLLAGAGAVLYGMALSVGNERLFGTLDTWLASPQHKLGAIVQRAVPHVADGFIGGLCTYLICCLLYGTMPIPLLLFSVLLVVAVVSSVGFSLSLAAVALIIEDVFVGPNAAELALMIFSGTLVPQGRLPAGLREVSEIFPLTRVMSIVDDQLARRAWSSGTMLAEIGVAAVWFAVSSALVSLAVRRASARTQVD